MRMDEPAFDQDGIGSWRTGDSVRLGMWTGRGSIVEKELQGRVKRET